MKPYAVVLYKSLEIRDTLVRAGGFVPEMGRGRRDFVAWPQKSAADGDFHHTRPTNITWFDTLDDAKDFALWLQANNNTITAVVLQSLEVVSSVPRQITKTTMKFTDQGLIPE